MIVTKPLPPIDPATQEYWRRCAQGELCVQVCNACGHTQHYPRWLCTACQSTDLALAATGGEATIKSFTIIRRAVSQAFESDVPYVVALVTLDEGPTMMTNIVNWTDETDVRIGRRVRVCFEQRADEIAVPQFQLIQ